MLAVGCCSFVIAAPAQAKSHRVTGGHSTVTTSSAVANLVAFLRAHGIRVTAIKPAKFTHGSLTLPIVSGSMTIPNMRGVMNFKGGLQFTKGNRVLRIRSYRLSHEGGRATLSALVSGRRVPLHRIVLERMVGTKVKMTGKTGTMNGGLKITPTWARLINQLLGKHVLSPGADVGDLFAKVHMA
jgi:hypothetical protein